MSLIIKQAKIKKTEDKENYHKQYRLEHLGHIQNMERVNYYKNKYNIDDEFIGKFGEYSAKIFKIQKEITYIKEHCSELIPHIFDLFK